MRALPTSMTLVMPQPHVLGPKYERRQRPRNSQGFRIGKSGGNPARTPDVAGVISLNWFMAPVDDNVTAQSTLQSTKEVRAGGLSDVWPKIHATQQVGKRVLLVLQDPKTENKKHSRTQEFFRNIHGTVVPWFPTEECTEHTGSSCMAQL